MPFRFRKKLRATKKLILGHTKTRRRAKSRLYQLSMTVAIFGAQSAGKTTVARNFTQKSYPDGFQKATEFYNVDITLVSSDGISCKHELSVHDTPGNLRNTFRNLYENVIRQNDAFILVFSLSDSHGLEEVTKTLNDIKRLKGKQVPTLVVANKADIESKNEVDVKKRFLFYRDIATVNIPCVEISSKQAVDFRQHWVPLLIDIEERHDVKRLSDPSIIG